MFFPFAFIKPSQVASPPMYMDPDALLFITASAITDSTQKYAINQLVLGLKTDNIWTKMTALYPFVGGTATTHKFNLKDPRDLNAAYRIQFNGGWLHNANGIQGDGGSSNANTFAATNTTAIPNQSNHWSLYQRQIANNGGSGWFGAFDYPGNFTNFGMVGSNNQNLGLGLQNYTFFNSPAVPVYPAFYNGTVLSSNNSALYINGTSSYSFNSATSFVNTFDFYLGAMWFNGAPYNSHNAQVAFASLGNSLTATNASNFYTRVQAFQTTLGRYIGTPITLPPITAPPIPNDPNAQAFIDAAGISNTTQQSAINQLVLDLKSYSIWNKINALYPFVGGTATTHKYNLKDPRDLNDAYRIQFNGGWTHDANGIQSDGSTGYADTFAAYNGIIARANNHWSAYQTTVSQPNTTYTGIFDSGICFGFSAGGSSKYVGLQNNAIGAPESIGFWNGTVPSSFNGVLYKNDTSVYTINQPFDMSFTLFNYYIGGLNFRGTFSGATTSRFAFVSLGIGLTSTDAANLYTAVQRYQTTLGRQI